MSKNTGNSVLIEPMSIPKETDAKVKNIQNFLAFTTGIKPTKPETCALILEEGIPAYEKKIQRFIK